MWGTDLSGSVQGAGGVGGLLAINAGTNATHFLASDGNGNIVALVNATNGTATARFDYGPFGESIRTEGRGVKACPVRFSTKYEDSETDFLYYGHRYYNPSIGRWLNRDLVEERGGLNLYGFVDEDTLNQIDILGLEGRPLPVEDTKCCTSDKIAKGEQQLNARFQIATATARQLGLRPAPPGQKTGATCKNSSIDIIDWLAPYPSCWRCYLEQRNYFSPTEDPNDDRLDHQVIICSAYAPGAKLVKEIIFDWYGDTSHPLLPQSGGSPDKFKGDYKYPGGFAYNPYYSDCSGNPVVTKLPTPCFACSQRPRP
jgi:RHS repeat-associated protein